LIGGELSDKCPELLVEADVDYKKYYHDINEGDEMYDVLNTFVSNLKGDDGNLAHVHYEPTNGEGQLTDIRTKAQDAFGGNSGGA
jgi:hypothetical protein